MARLGKAADAPAVTTSHSVRGAGRCPAPRGAVSVKGAWRSCGRDRGSAALVVLVVLVAVVLVPVVVVLVVIEVVEIVEVVVLVIVLVVRVEDDQREWRCRKRRRASS